MEQEEVEGKIRSYSLLADALCSVNAGESSPAQLFSSFHKLS